MSPQRKKQEWHGGTNEPLYRAWWDMLQRCYNANGKHYDRYGGRGIAVCDRWKNSYAAFREDMIKRPAGMTLERIDNDKGYSKENCRWVSRWEQSVNRSNNRMMTVNGVTKPIAAWARETKLPYDLIYYRKHRAGWKDADCLAPTTKSPLATVNGMSVSQIAAKLGISVNSVYTRIKKGWTVDEIVNRPNSQPYMKKFAHG